MSKTIVTTRATTWDTSSSATFTDTFILSNLGPLTTTFTPASDCLNTWYATSVHLELGVQSRTDCFPPGFTPGNYHTSGYYSPGLCPASYTGAKSLDLWWTAPGESGVQCCPIGYWLPAAVTASCFTPLSSTITTSVTDGTIVRTVVLSEIWAPAIPVFWKGLVDPPVVTTASGTNPSSTTTGASPAGSVSHSPPGTSPTVTSTVGDTSGAAHPTASQPNHSTTIAIATAIPLVLIALSIAAFIFLRRRRARQNAAATTDLTDDCLPELEGNAAHVHKPGAPFWPAPIELPTIPAPIELPTRPAQPVELPAVGSPPSLLVETPHVPGGPAAPPADIIVAVAGRLGDAMAQPTACED